MSTVGFEFSECFCNVSILSVFGVLSIRRWEFSLFILFLINSNWKYEVVWIIPFSFLCILIILLTVLAITGKLSNMLLLFNHAIFIKWIGRFSFGKSECFIRINLISSFDSPDIVHK